MSAARRFAFVSSNFYPCTCGIGDHSLRLAQELVRRGHQAAIFSRQPAQPHPAAPEIAVTGVPAGLPTLVARRLAAALLAQAPRPTDVILQFTGQMLDAWRFGSPAVVWLARRLRRAGLRVTVIAHELHVPWLPRPDLIAAAALQRVQMAALVASADRIFVTTETRARGLIPICRLLGVPEPGVVRVGPNALPIPRAAPAPDAASGGDAAAAPRIGVFSTAAVGKRFDVVLGAFERIAREFPAARLILIGDLGAPGAPRVREITETIARHPARARIRLTGKLALDEVAREIAALDLYLFPMSTGANTRSGTLPVALGAGLPVVAIRGPETDIDLFHDGENVAFARDLDAAAFADAALALLRDPARAAHVGAGARALYLDHLGWDRIADKLLADLSAPPP